MLFWHLFIIIKKKYRGLSKKSAVATKASQICSQWILVYWPRFGFSRNNISRSPIDKNDDGQIRYDMLNVLILQYLFQP